MISRMKSALPYLFFLLICLVSAFHSGWAKGFVYDPGGEATPGTVALNWSVDQVYQYYKGADLASYIEAAQRGTTPAFWSPGMAWYVAFVLNVFGGDFYPLKMILMSVFLFSFALYFFWTKVPPIRGSRAISAVLVGSILLLPCFREWTFGFGALMSETPSHAFFLIAITFWLEGLRSQSTRAYVWAGISFAVAAYLKASFEIIGSMLFVVSVGAVAGLWVLRKIRRTPFALPRSLLGALIIASVFQGALFPWRMHNSRHFHTMKWLPLPEEYEWQWTFKYDEEQPGFHKSGNAACHADPELCKTVHDNLQSYSGAELKRLTVKSAILHPIGYYSYKLKHFPFFWIGVKNEELPQRVGVILEGLFFLFMGFFSLAYSWKVFRSGNKAAGALLVGVIFFLLANGALYSFANYEWRYSESLRVLFFFAPFMVVSLQKTLLRDA